MDNITKTTDKIIISNDKVMKQFKLCFLTSVVLMVVFSAFQHFLYDWTQCPFFALWTPVGESPAEHGKLMFYPSLLWWVITYFAFRKKLNINAANWFAATAVSSVLSVSLLTLFYCTFFEGFAWPQNLALHIMLEIISFIIAQLAGYHVYRHAYLKSRSLIVSFAAIAAVIITMAVCTFYPPDIPLYEVVAE